LIIRPATLSDADGIACVHVQAWRESYRELIPQAALDALAVEKRAAQWRHTLGNPDRTTFVAEHDDAVCGFVSGGGILWSGLPTGSEVSALYLLDAAKRRGVGRALLERLIANLIDNGIRHNEPGGFLDVSTRVLDGRVELRETIGDVGE